MTLPNLRIPMRLLSLVALIALLSGPVRAQDACGMGGCTHEDAASATPVTDAQRRLSEREVFLMATEILAVSGLANTLKIEETMEVFNAAAYLEDGERWIGFNPLWVLRFKDLPTDARWPLYAVVAHEIGHHLMGHTIIRGGSRPATELEADAYAGFVLHALGADLPQAQALWQDFSLTGSDTHPARDLRLAAVEAGWLRSAGRAGLALPGGDRGPPDVPRSIRQRPDDGTTATGAQTAPEIPAETRGPDVAHPALALHAVCAPLPKGGPRGRLCASSALDAAQVARLTDDDLRTPWTEQDPGPGTGTRFLFDFAAPVVARRLSVVNGDNGDEKAFQRSARLEAVTLRGSNGHSRTIVVRDSRREQTWTLAEFEGVDWIEVTVDSVIAGRRYDTLAVSRLRID